MENTPIRWQRLPALTRQLVASTLNGRPSARLLCTLALATGLAVSTMQAQSGTGSVNGRVLNVGNSKYVANAVVTVEGTTLETLTNEYGEYRLGDVPAGDAMIKVVSSGLDTETATVAVTAGATATKDFDLTSAERYGDDKTVKLDTFVGAATYAKRLKIFANVRNIFNKPQVLQRYSETAGTAPYAVNYQQEEFGIQIAVGIKGTF